MRFIMCLLVLLQLQCQYWDVTFTILKCAKNTLSNFL